MSDRLYRKKPGGSWYGWFYDRRDKRRIVCTRTADREVALRILAKREKVAHGLLHPRSESARIPGRPTPALLVYFIEAGPGGPIKIGSSHDVARRMANMQTAMPFDLRTLATISGANRAESELHRRFKHLRIRGEWYRAEPDLVALIAALRVAA